jgi:hypothetical protein
MMKTPPTGRQPAPESFAYFMLRLRHTDGVEDEPLAGLIERLGTGEKRSFEDARELVALLGVWQADRTKSP